MYYNILKGLFYDKWLMLMCPFLIKGFSTCLLRKSITAMPHWLIINDSINRCNIAPLILTGVVTGRYMSKYYRYSIFVD